MHTCGEDISDCCNNNLCSREVTMKKCKQENNQILRDSLFTF
jgi:hypothetical protein